ncbi:MAG: transposase [Microbacter sp.]
MAVQKTPLNPGKYYHIYNRGNNRNDLFYDNENYEYFLNLYQTYISPVTNTFAWVLMKNHFHLLMQILPPERWGNLNADGLKTLRNLELDKRINQQFSNLFNAYSKAINLRYGRTRSLFEHPFKRKENASIDYLKRVIVYIHQNLVKHGFCEHPLGYPWSSYHTCISIKPTKVEREKVIGWFGSSTEFISRHNGKIKTNDINQWLELDE